MIYLTEIADKEIRGALGMLVQVMNNLGSLVLYGIGPFVSYNVLNLIVLFISAFFALLCLWVPESPYYHLARGNVAAAKKSFLFLKGSKDSKVRLLLDSLKYTKFSDNHNVFITVG